MIVYFPQKKNFIILVWVIVLKTKLITFYNPIALWLCKYWWQISITHTHLSLFLSNQTRMSIQHYHKLINVFILSWLFSMWSFDFFPLLKICNNKQWYHCRGWQMKGYLGINIYFFQILPAPHYWRNINKYKHVLKFLFTFIMCQRYFLCSDVSSRMK